MSDNTIPGEKRVTKTDSPGKQLLLTMVVAFLGLFVGQFLGLALIKLLYGGSFQDISLQLEQPLEQPALKFPLILLQGVGSICGFFIFPFFLAKKRNYLNLSELFAKKRLEANGLLLLLAITLVTITISGSLGEWNKAIVLPEWLNWLKSRDTEIERLTEYLTKFDSIAYLIVCFIVIAVVAAIVEEFLFRGLIQKQFIKATGNYHLGIWITAFVFGAMHMQFVGLLPRMFIGAILGYIYVWKGSLVYPVFMHMLNNGLTLVIIYLHQKGIINIDIEQVSTPLYVTFLLTIGLIGMLIYYKRLSSQEFKNE